MLLKFVCSLVWYLYAKTRTKSGNCIEKCIEFLFLELTSRVLWIRCLPQGVGWSLLAASQSHLPVTPVDLRMLAHFWSILGQEMDNVPWPIVKLSASIGRKLMTLID